MQRAYKTAGAINLAQGHTDEDGHNASLEVTRLAILREQDFGSFEGRPFHARQRASNVSGKENHQSRLIEDPDFRDVESKDSMNIRVERFIRDQLLPLYDGTHQSDAVVCVVSHGIILSHLWKCFLKQFSGQNVTFASGLYIGNGSKPFPEHLGLWSNTGYLELNVERLSVKDDRNLNYDDKSLSSATKTIQAASPLPLSLLIKTVNGRDHLKNLKRTRGGVGSAKHDEGQRKIESFFKKPRSG